MKNSLELTLGGVGYMVQSLGGFLIDIKYGVMTAERPVATDRTLAYGISFGGNISIPIEIPSSAKKDDKNTNENSKKDEAENQIKKADEEIDYSDALQNLFKEDEPETPETPGTGGTTDTNPGTMVNSNTTKPKQSKPQSDFKKETNLDSGLISAAIDDVRFGQQTEENDDGTVEITDTGFVGIDATLSLGLPKDVLGSLVSNAPGIYASLTINTIEHFYMLEAGLDIKMIQCEGVLSFMMTEVKDVEIVVPDSIQFYIRDGLQIPLVPPVFYMTGLGGGIDGLADTIGGEFSKLPPLTLLLFTRLEVVELLSGDFNVGIALTGINFDGELAINTMPVSKVKNNDNGGTNDKGNTNGQGGTDDKGSTDDKGNTNVQGGINGAKNSPKNPANRTKFAQTVLDTLKSPVNLQFGASARWIDPICFKGYGNVNIIGGLLNGGVTITITDKSFYGYAYLSLCIPDAIPIIGGRELAGVEAAISDKFLGANIKILGIKLGFIYYWDGDFSFGTGINLMGLDNVDYPEYNTRAVFGTNLRKLQKGNASGVQLFAVNDSVSHTFTVAGLDSAVIEIPFDAGAMPTADDFVITNPNGTEISLIEDDGSGNGTYLVQSRDDGYFIYVSVTDENLLVNGNWTITQKTDKLTVNTFDIYSVEDIPEITSISYTRGNDTSSYDIDLSWTLDSDSESGGYLDVYISDDVTILEKLKANSTDNFDPIAHIELDNIESGKENVKIPDGMESGTYYVAAMLTNKSGGMSTAISTSPFEFENKKLPNPVKSAALTYAGNGEIYVEVEDADAPEYTHYVVEVVAEDGSTLSNNINEFAIGEDIFIGKEANLVPGSNYYVNIKTLKAEGDKKFYYGSEVVKSDTITMPAIDKPVLLNVETNIKGNITSEETLEITYTFDRPVWMFTTINETTMNATTLKEKWTLYHKLDDGDYVVDFTAYGANKDSVTGANFPNVENATMGFSVDTGAPALSIKKSALETVATEGD